MNFDPFDMIRQMQERAKTCTHSQMMGVWGKTDGPKKVCLNCGYSYPVSEEAFKTEIMGKTTK